MSEAIGIEIPKGSPDALMGAAGLWDGLADVMDGNAAGVNTATTAVTEADWHGEASAAYAGRANDIALRCTTAAASWRQAATCCRRFAPELEEAQQRAK